MLNNDRVTRHLARAILAAVFLPVGYSFSALTTEEPDA